MAKETQELSGQRKLYARNLLATIKKENSTIKPSASVVSKRFSLGMKGFELLFDPEEVTLLIEYFSKSGIKASHQGNGNFFVEFPESLERKRQEKDLISLCEKERKGLLGALRRKGFETKRGRNKKGTIRCNLSSSIASTMTLIITVINNSTDTFKTVANVVKGYYKEVGTVTINARKEDSTIEVKFSQGHFKLTEETDVHEKIILPAKSNGDSILSSAIEIILHYGKDIMKIAEQIAQTEGQAVFECFKRFFEIEKIVLEREGVKRKKDTVTGEPGKQVFISEEISDEYILEKIAEEIAIQYGPKQDALPAE